ncbi:hypothetical protein JCM8547_005234 [Rhodosporidiobolus lusitaniae]
MPSRTTRRRAPSPTSSESSDSDLSSLFSSSSGEGEKEQQRRRPSRKSSSRRKGVIYRSLPAQGVSQGERSAPDDAPVKQAGPGPSRSANGHGNQTSSRTCIIVTIVVILVVLGVGGGAAYVFRDDLKNHFSSSAATDDSGATVTSSTALSTALSSETATSSAASKTSESASSSSVGLSSSSSGTSTSTGTSSASTSSSSSSNGISTSQTYTLSRECLGEGFFSCFIFNIDKGVSSSVASSSGLVSTDDDGTAYIRLNSWEDLEDEGDERPKVYLVVDGNEFEQGLVIVDVEKMPYGCGAWSSIFSYGKDWPAGGGIDTFEGISLQTQSTPTVITSDSGCKLGGSDSMTGTPLEGHTDCSDSTEVDGYSGCSVQNPSTSSYGEAWNAAGGGVLATLLDSTGVYIWQFSRADVPANLDMPDPSSWGLPLAAWSASTCSMDYFSAQTLAITLGVCGTRPEANWSGECASLADTCAEYVKTGANLENMVWGINYLRLYDISSGESSSGSGSSSSFSSSGGTVTLAVEPTTIGGNGAAIMTAV